MDMLNKPASFSRRICAALIDIVLIAIIYILMHYITTSIANAIFHYNDLISEANGYLNQYYDYAVKAGLVIYNSESELYKFVEGITAESTEYVDFMASELIKNLENQYSIACNKINIIKLVKFMIDILVAESIFFLVIPLIRKDNATLGKVFMKLSVINKKDIRASKLQIVVRFLALYAVETIFFYFFFEELAIIILPLVEIAFICFTKQRLAMHDFFAGTKVIENETAIVFDNIEEIEDYYSQKEKDDIDYAKKREEYRKKTGIDMKGFNK